MVLRATRLVDLHWFWVRGHSRVDGNEAADKLAKRGAAGERICAPASFYDVVSDD